MCASASPGNEPIAPPPSPGGWLSLLAWPLLAVIRFYRRFISPLTPASCRFYPSCSAYGLEAITLHGPFKGTAMTIWRILRCQPFHPGGFDPVPGSELQRRHLAGELDH